jgi:hypothetical protein
MCGAKIELGIHRSLMRSRPRDFTLRLCLNNDRKHLACGIRTTTVRPNRSHLLDRPVGQPPRRPISNPSLQQIRRIDDLANLARGFPSDRTAWLEKPIERVYFASGAASAESSRCASSSAATAFESSAPDTGAKASNFMKKQTVKYSDDKGGNHRRAASH